MLGALRTLTERFFIGDSIPRMVRLAKSVPRGIIQRLASEAFEEVVRYAARKQKCFRRKLREAGIVIRSVHQPSHLGNVFTTPEELVSLPAEEFLCRAPQAVFETTGTSGNPKRIYFGYDELEHTARYEAAALYENGVRASDRVACTFDTGYWIAGQLSFLACQKIGAFCSALGKPLPRDFYQRLPTYQYNVLMADPTWLVSLSEIAEREGRFPLKMIIAAGDRMSDAHRNYIESVWRAPVIVGYGSTETTGAMGMECRRREGYHLDEYNFLFEILKPNDEGYGELVVTTLARRTMPFIRYRVRDVTRFLDEPCPCGATLRRLSPIKGRVDEMVVMGAGNMYPAIFERVLAGLPGISENWQVAFRQKGTKDVMEFRLESTNGTGGEILVNAVKKNLRELYPEVWANYQCGMFEIEVSAQPSPPSESRRKLKRLVDEREP